MLRDISGALLLVGRIGGNKGIQRTLLLALPSNCFCNKGIVAKRFLQKQRRLVGLTLERKFLIKVQLRP